jgi:hypothetical protein
VLDRLLDLLLIAVLRAWFSRPEAEAPGSHPVGGSPGGSRLGSDPLRGGGPVAVGLIAGVGRAGRFDKQ